MCFHIRGVFLNICVLRIIRLRIMTQFHFRILHQNELHTPKGLEFPNNGLGKDHFLAFPSDQIGQMGFSAHGKSRWKMMAIKIWSKLPKRPSIATTADRKKMSFCNSQVNFGSLVKLSVKNDPPSIKKCPVKCLKASYQFRSIIF